MLCSAMLCYATLRYAMLRNALLGTLCFSAPEQLTSRTYDTPADVWAFGCVLTCLWTDSEYPYPPSADEDNPRGGAQGGGWCRM